VLGTKRLTITGVDAMMRLIGQWYELECERCRRLTATRRHEELQKLLTRWRRVGERRGDPLYECPECKGDE
jgi:hypothetical protein